MSNATIAPPPSAQIAQRIEQVARHGFFQSFQRKCRDHAQHVARNPELGAERCRYLRELGLRNLPLDADAIDCIIAGAMEAAGVPPLPPSAPPLQPDAGSSQSAAVAEAPEPAAAADPMPPEPSQGDLDRAAPPEAGGGSLDIATLDRIKAERVDWLWPGRIALGRISILAGDPGLGKSHAALSIAATVTRGGAWPCGEGQAGPGDVLVLTAEDSLGDTVRPRFDAAGGDASRMHAIRAVIRDGSVHGFDLDGDLALLERELARRPEVRLVIVDPVTAYLRGSGDRSENVRRVVTPIAAMAERRRVAVLLVTHLSKRPRRAIHGALGSVAWVAAARASFLVMADPHDETRRLLLTAKNNLADTPGLAFRLASRVLSSGLEASHVAWEDTIVEASAEEVLRQQPRFEGSAARRDATAFLLAALADGPKPVREIEGAAIRAGLLASGVSVSRSSAIRAARERLGVQSIRTGGVADAGEWVWALPGVGESAGPLSRENHPLVLPNGRGSSALAEPRG